MNCSFSRYIILLVALCINMQSMTRLMGDLCFLYFLYFLYFLCFLYFLYIQILQSISVASPSTFYWCNNVLVIFTHHTSRILFCAVDRAEQNTRNSPAGISATHYHYYILANTRKRKNVLFL